jgi:hypothetical protein
MLLSGVRFVRERRQGADSGLGLREDPAAEVDDVLRAEVAPNRAVSRGAKLRLAPADDKVIESIDARPQLGK